MDWIHGHVGVSNTLGALGVGLTMVGAAVGISSPRPSAPLAPLVPLAPPVVVPPVVEVASAIATAAGFNTLAAGLGVAAPLVAAAVGWARKRKAPEASAYAPPLR